MSQASAQLQPAPQTSPATQPMTTVPANRRGRRFNWTPWLFMAPFLSIFTVIVLVPVIQSFWLSVTYFNVLESPQYIGLSNFQKLFLEDDLFLKSLKNTAVFATSVGPGGFLLALVLAWSINMTPVRMRPYFTFVYYVPSMLAGITMAAIWKYVLSGDRYGVLNNVAMQLGIIHEPYQWLAKVDSIMPVMITVALWGAMGIGFLSLRAGILSVPGELYEAARIDGISGRVEELWYITLPMIRPQLLFAAVIAIVGAFKVDQLSQTLFGFPSPLYAAHTALTHIHDYAFVRFEMGYAAAVSVIFISLIYGINRVVMRLLSSSRDL